MECLHVGYEAPGADLSEIKSQWLRHNHDISKGVKAMTVDKRNGVYKSVCACAPNTNIKEWKDNTVCKAHIFIYKNKVTSIRLEHDCSASDPGRKRQYSFAMINLASNEMREYDGPTRERGKSVQKYAEAAKAAGFEMGRTQAYKVLRRINQDPIETHIGQYFLLTSMIKLWKRADMGGTYEIDTVSASWNDKLDSFQRLYVAPSFAKHAWKKCHMRFITLNASFRTGGHFSHTVLLAVTYDANDDIIILATGICDEESSSGSNWVWFMQNLIRDFPGIQLVLSGSKHVMENTELSGLLKLIAAQRCWCIRQLIEECPEKLSKEERAIVAHMARATTVQLYNYHLQNLHKGNTSIATWFDSRKQLFASHVFLESGKTRFGKVEDTTDSDDTIQEIMENITDKPIATLLRTYMEKWLQLHKTRNLAVTQTQHPQQRQHQQMGVCPGVYQDYKNKDNDAAEHSVQLVFSKDGLLKAYVSFSKADQPLHRILVSASTTSHEVKCPCQQGLETGCPCVHCAALLRAQSLNTGDARWFHERYHASTQIAIYNPPNFPHFSCLEGRLSVVEITPPEQGRLSQHNKRKQYYSGTTNKEMARVCRACGEKGHHHKTCQKPSTEYQYERFALQAKKWAKQQTDVKVVFN